MIAISGDATPQWTYLELSDGRQSRRSNDGSSKQGKSSKPWLCFRIDFRGVKVKRCPITYGCTDRIRVLRIQAVERKPCHLYDDRGYLNSNSGDTYLISVP